RRRMGRGLRVSLLSGTLGMFALFGGAQAASATAKLTSVSPNEGCAGTEVTFTGSGFLSGDEAKWRDPFAQKFPNLNSAIVVESSTTAKGVVPLFLQTQGATLGAPGVGTVSIMEGMHESNALKFTYKNVQNCGGSGGGEKGEKGATGATGPAGPEGPA